MRTLGQHLSLIHILIEEVDREYGELFGRSYGGAIEEYRMEDAEYAIITTGSMSGAAKDMVDAKRQEGLKAGLVRMRMIRPFPKERIQKALANVKAFGAVSYTHLGSKVFCQRKGRDEEVPGRK